MNNNLDVSLEQLSNSSRIYQSLQVNCYIVSSCVVLVSGQAQEFQTSEWTNTGVLKY